MSIKMREQNFEREHDFLFKIVVVGDSNVGKSSLICRYCDESFTDSFISTIGIDFKFKTLEEKGKKVKLQIWDSSGQERFRSIIPSLYRGAKGIVLVFDVTDVSSFKNVSLWIEEIKKTASEDAQLILVGNKSDLMESREVERIEAQQFAFQNDCLYFETSAKSTENVEFLFQEMTRLIFKRRGENVLNSEKKEIIVPIKPISSKKIVSCNFCSIL